MSVIKIAIVALVLIGLGIFSWKKPRLSSILIWSLLATVLITTVILVTLPVDFSSKAQWLSFLVPLILVGFQYWCYWANSERLVLLGLVALSIVSGGIVMVVDPII